MQISWFLALVLSLVVNYETELPANCEDIFSNVRCGHTLSGVYTIYSSGHSVPVQVYCDMDCGNNHVHDEGRWTVSETRYLVHLTQRNTPTFWEIGLFTID
ncbi:microfibril-associated glycoprotein 4-like isoform X2 [Alosa sapidissima]|uniref:microfibril-associated glycoprotein 4-like isoform X2 n=1 Tax=Alosa sapidissima TaxID=34773 RepID=UPI001C08D588|nr:microfibril-associated glycoprotein 4-like isoform X2 [Alosa sapidissima]